MTTFLSRAIERAGLGGIFAARKRGDLDAVRAMLRGDIDILILGAIADAYPRRRVRRRGSHPRMRTNPVVTWIPRGGKSELELLRACAIARITMARGAAIGLDWATQGLEIQQVALGFGITDLTGPMTRKAGDLIEAEALKKVQGQGMVAQTALRRLEIAALIKNAGRRCVFTDDVAAPSVDRFNHVEEGLNA